MLVIFRLRKADDAGIPMEIRYIYIYRPIYSEYP